MNRASDPWVSAAVLPRKLGLPPLAAAAVDLHDTVGVPTGT